MAAVLPPITLYSAAICPWAQRATLAVDELGVEVTKVEIDLQNKPDWYASKVNPASKVPVIQLGKDDEPNVKIPESHVILELLADLYKDTAKSILPDTAVSRAEARYFIERVNQVLWSPLMGLLFKGTTEVAAAVLPGAKEISELLGRHPGPFFLGEKISLADLGVAPFVGRFFAFGKAGVFTDDTFEQITTKPEFKALVDYHHTLTSRPSWAATFNEEKIVGYMKKRLAPK